MNPKHIDPRTIYNRALGISGQSVMDCGNGEKLREWQMSIAMQRTELLFANGVKREDLLPPGEKVKALFLRRLETLIYRRRKELGERRREREVAREAIAFRTACKNILPNWQYELIEEKSKLY